MRTRQYILLFLIAVLVTIFSVVIYTHSSQLGPNVPTLPTQIAQTTTAIAEQPTILPMRQSAEIGNFEVTLMVVTAQKTTYNQQTITCHLKFINTSSERQTIQDGTFILRGQGGSIFTTISTTLPTSVQTQQAIAGDVTFLVPQADNGFLLVYTPNPIDNVQAMWRFQI